MKLQSTMTPQRIKAIFESLQYLASLDGDRARELNGQGFNKVDGTTGHRLANSFNPVYERIRDRVKAGSQVSAPTADLPT